MTTEEFIYEQEENEQLIYHFFHDYLVNDLGLTPKIRFGIPFYYFKTWLLYLNPLRKGGVELVFLQGRELRNDQGILYAKGRKLVRGIEINSLEEAPLESIQEIIQEAISLQNMK